VFAYLSSLSRAVRARLAARGRPKVTAADRAALTGAFAGADPTGYRDRNDRV
jgi:hypothetical protein